MPTEPIRDKRLHILLSAEENDLLTALRPFVESELDRRCTVADVVRDLIYDRAKRYGL